MNKQLELTKSWHSCFRLPGSRSGWSMGMLLAADRMHVSRRAGTDLMGLAVMIGGGLREYRRGWYCRRGAFGEVLIQGVAGGRTGRGRRRLLVWHLGHCWLEGQLSGGQNAFLGAAGIIPLLHLELWQISSAFLKLPGDPSFPNVDTRRGLERRLVPHIRHLGHSGLPPLPNHNKGLLTPNQSLLNPPFCQKKQWLDSSLF